MVSMPVLMSVESTVILYPPLGAAIGAVQETSTAERLAVPILSGLYSSYSVLSLPNKINGGEVRSWEEEYAGYNIYNYYKSGVLVQLTK